MNKQAYDFGFEDELKKIAGELSIPEGESPRDAFGQVVKHPLSFAGNVGAGYLAGRGIGTIGGAIASAPIAALIALKDKKAAKEFMSKGLTAEAVGGGLAGGLMGGTHFFKKDSNK